MDLDGRRLRYFVTVAELGGLSRAAEVLHVAQPALSRQMRLLEESVGVSLFRRTARGMTLTAAGEQYYCSARRLLDDARVAQRQAQLVAGGHRGHLRVGFSEIYTLHPDVLRALQDYRRQSPEVTFTVEAMLSGAITERVLEGHLDIALAYSGQIDVDSALDSRPWIDDEYRLAVHVDSALARRPPERLAELWNEDFILFRRDQSPRMHDLIIHHFHQRGLSPRIVQEGTSHHTVLALVAAGLGCSVMPVSAQERMPASVRLIDVPDLELRTPVRLVWRRENCTPLVERFAALLTAPHC